MLYSPVAEQAVDDAHRGLQSRSYAHDQPLSSRRHPDFLGILQADPSRYHLAYSCRNASYLVGRSEYVSRMNI